MVKTLIVHQVHMKNTLMIGFIVAIVLLTGGLLMYKYQRPTVPMPQLSEQDTASNNARATSEPVKNNISPTVPNFDTASQISLTVSQPLNNTVVKVPKITVIGKTVPNAEVSVNDSDLKADAQGNFSASIVLDEGDNTVIVIANDAQGNFSEKDITVSYDSGNQYQ